jgi:hypothetical protein
MSNREDRLRSLLERVRAKRPDERETHAADAVERMRTASGTTSAAAVQSAPPMPPAAQPTPVPSAFPTQAAPEPLEPFESVPAIEPPTTPGLESPTRYSSQPPRVERPLSVEPRARSVGVGAPATTPPPPAASEPAPARPQSIRAPSVAPTGQPVVYATDPPEFPRAKTFGDLLELSLSLRPR